MTPEKQSAPFDPKATGRQLGAYKSAAKKAGCTLEEWMRRRSVGEHRCYRCEGWKPAEQFSLDATRGPGRASICKPCTSEAATASRYGLTPADLAQMRSESKGKCPICKKTKTLVVDHDHATGGIRGLLCSGCNVGLGLLGDTPQRLRAALAYLEP